MFSKLRTVALILLYYGACYIQPIESYNRWTGNIVCEYRCEHEEGHKYDHDHGMISLTDEFKEAINLYFRYQVHVTEKDPAFGIVMDGMMRYKFDYRRYPEIYAEIYALDEKPELLRGYYGQ